MAAGAFGRGGPGFVAQVSQGGRSARRGRRVRGPIGAVMAFGAAVTYTVDIRVADAIAVVSTVAAVPACGGRARRPR